MSDGQNIRFGNTNDGLVFMSLNGTIEEKPIELLFQWTPQDARKIANTLNDIVNRLEKQDERDCANFN
uniref:Uncharacterized protein n=1 Tax=viral metagenome TaxID=1070528 RepID=A0A6M3LJE5_9ZZZZ